MGRKEAEMKLAVCIPNYNRPQELYRLLKGLADQIVEDELSGQVELCINDDRSTENPDRVIEIIRKTYPEVQVTFQVNEKNMGLDYNFLQCVMISGGEYCWIIGNDDEPEEGALRKILNYVSDSAIDIMVSPFSMFDECGNILATIEPVMTDSEQPVYFHTENPKEYEDLLRRSKDGNALTCFLSNVVFRRSRWVEHGNMFENKMNTIFIQIYMNLQTLKEGAVYAYIPEKIIKQHSDDEVNVTFKREYDVLVGLSGVIDFFFDGEIHELLQERIVDPRINGRMWALPDDSPLKAPILKIQSVKNSYYQKYFIRPEQREAFFSGKDVMVYGAGNYGRKAIAELEGYSLGSLSLFDSDEKKWEKKVDGYKVRRLDELKEKYNRENSLIVVANNRSLVEIVDKLLQDGLVNIAFII